MNDFVLSLSSLSMQYLVTNAQRKDEKIEGEAVIINFHGNSESHNFQEGVQLQIVAYIFN